MTVVVVMGGFLLGVSATVMVDQRATANVFLGEYLCMGIYVLIRRLCLSQSSGV